MNKHGKCGSLLNGVGDLVTADVGKAEALYAFFASVFTTKSSKLLRRQTTSSGRRLSHGSLEKSQPIQVHGTRREASKCAG